MEIIRTTNITDELSGLQNHFQQLTTSFPIEEIQLKHRGDKNALIIKNIVSIIPNIEYENTRKKYTVQNQYEWLTGIKTYMEEINRVFEKAYENEIEDLICYINLEEKTKAFDMKKMDLLPEDVIRYIHDFLPHETRIELLLARYPNLEEGLMKLRLRTLKFFLSKVAYNQYYMPLYTDKTIRDKNYYRCLTKHFTIRMSGGTKAIAINEIMKLFNEFKNANPISKKKHRYFTKRALQLLINMLILTGISRTPNLVNDTKIPKQTKKSTAKTNQSSQSNQ